MSSPGVVENSYAFRRNQSASDMLRDPRKRRHRNSSGSGAGDYPNQESDYRKSGHRDRSRGNSSRSRSRSPALGGFSSHMSRGGPRDPRLTTKGSGDEWTKTTDAFLKNLGAASNKNNDQVRLKLGKAI